MSDDCLFCKIAEGAIPAQKVAETDLVVAFRDINPQAPTHIQIIPRKHIATVNDIQPEDAPVLAAMVATAQSIAREQGFAEQGYRLVFNCNQDAGQSVYHIHLHLLAGRRLSWPPG